MCYLTKDGLIPEKNYDIVIDKGCTDCLMSDPSKNVTTNLTNAFREIYNTMKDTAIFYLVSTCKAEKRISYLTSAGSSTNINMIELSIKKY